MSIFFDLEEKLQYYWTDDYQVNLEKFDVLTTKETDEKND